MKARTDTIHWLLDGVWNARRASRVADTVMGVLRFGETHNVPLGVCRGAIIEALAANGAAISDLSVPAIDASQSTLLSSVRVRAMELGLSPWPSASGWAPADLPWAERRILIGIVEGIASMARIQKCSGCGEPMCGYMNERVCPLCKAHVCGASFGALCSASNNNATVAPPPRIVLDPGRWDNGCPFCQDTDCGGDC